MRQVKKRLDRLFGEIIVENWFIAHSITADKLIGVKIGHGIQNEAAAALLAVWAFENHLKIGILFLLNNKVE